MTQPVNGADRVHDLKLVEVIAAVYVVASTC
jgi:hypothetical protein